MILQSNDYKSDFSTDPYYEKYDPTKSVRVRFAYSPTATITKEPTNFEQVLEFHRAFNLPIQPEPTRPVDRQELRWKLIKEEYKELRNELVDDNDNPIDTVDLAAIAKEMADLLYVIYGMAAEYGIDLDKVFREVHNSNMSKLGEDGKPIYREDGKVMKGPNYFQANVDRVLKDSKLCR